MPYFFIESARVALYWSIGITTIVLLVFGAFKTFFTGAEIGRLPQGQLTTRLRKLTSPPASGIRGYTYGSLVTLLVGGAAAGASFGCVPPSSLCEARFWLTFFLLVHSIVRALEGGGM